MSKENPSYPLADWQHEVAELSTHLGYDEWLAHRIESETGVSLMPESGYDVYTLTRLQGQQVAEILRRYVREELRSRIEDEDSMLLLRQPDIAAEIQKDIDYIEGLEKLFAGEHKTRETKGTLYLKLFHGRTSPAEDLDNWGSEGPIFGPLSYVHTTYANHVKLGQPSDPFDNLGDLHVDADLIYYDGVYYGDWSVCTIAQLSDDELARVTTYDESKSHH